MIPAAIVIAVLSLYLITLAPTVLWGDSAFFQRSAAEGLLKRDAGGHWLWLQFAQLATHLPWGTVAYRVNLLSAVAGTATLLLLYLAIRALGLSRSSATIACASLAVSHTFWMHAVRAEVYTVFTAAMTLELWLWFTWRRGHVWPIQLAAALYGLTLLGHQMALLLLPAGAYLLWRRRRWLDRRGWLLVLGLLVLGLLPFVAVVDWQAGQSGFLHALRLHFTQVDVDFTPAFLDVSLSQLPRDVAVWLGLLGLQFIGAAGLLGIYGLFGNTLRRVQWQTLLILYATCVLFAFSYRVNDQFVFYLPSYIAFAFFIARGWQRLESAGRFRSTLSKTALAFMIIALPMATYAALPRLLTRAGLNPLGIRELPGRDPNAYFLHPASQGDFGADVFARSALEALPRNAVIIADHTPFEPLRYLQSVEGLRPDVRLLRIEPGDDLAPIVRTLPAGSAVFLADDDPRYYRLDRLNTLPGACLRPFGNLYQLLTMGSAERCR
jgi:hypothetical protein